MTIALLLLGTTNVAFFPQDSGVTLPSPGSLGAIDDALDFLGVDEEPEALFVVDVSMSENHSMQSDITDHPVEVAPELFGPPLPGTAIRREINVSDHIHLRPKFLTIEGLITDTPSGVGALLIAPALIETFTSMPRRIQAFDTLEALRDNKTIMDVLTSVKVYTDMAISSLNIPRDTGTTRSLRFSITLKEMKFVTSAIAGRSDAIPDGMGETADMGTVETIPSG